MRLKAASLHVLPIFLAISQFWDTGGARRARAIGTLLAYSPLFRSQEFILEGDDKTDCFLVRNESAEKTISEFNLLVSCGT